MAKTQVNNVGASVSINNDAGESVESATVTVDANRVQINASRKFPLTQAGQIAEHCTELFDTLNAAQ